MVINYVNAKNTTDTGVKEALELHVYEPLKKIELDRDQEKSLKSKVVVSLALVDHELGLLGDSLDPDLRDYLKYRRENARTAMQRFTDAHPPTRGGTVVQMRERHPRGQSGRSFTPK
jgi:hypothetical protein